METTFINLARHQEALRGDDVRRTLDSLQARPSSALIEIVRRRVPHLYSLAAAVLRGRAIDLE